MTSTARCKMTQEPQLSRMTQLLFALMFAQLSHAEFGTPALSDAHKGIFDAQPGQDAVEEFLTASEAFKPTLDYDPKTNHLAINWRIAPDYYLYKHSIKLELEDSAGNFTDITSTLDASPSLRKTDPHLGQIQVFYNQANYRLPAEKAQLSVKNTDIAGIRVQYEGCASNGLCYEKQEVTLNAR